MDSEWQTVKVCEVTRHARAARGLKLLTCSTLLACCFTWRNRKSSRLPVINHCSICAFNTVLQDERRATLQIDQVMQTKTLNPGRRALAARRLNPMSVRTGQVLTVTIQWDNAQWLRGVFTQSACTSWSGRNQAGFTTIIPFLALSLQLYDLKEWLDPLTFTLLCVFFFTGWHLSYLFNLQWNWVFNRKTIFTNVTKPDGIWLPPQRMASHLAAWWSQLHVAMLPQKMRGCYYTKIKHKKNKSEDHWSWFMFF